MQRTTFTGVIFRCEFFPLRAVPNGVLIKDVDSSSRVKKTVRFEEHDVGVKPFIPRRKTIEDLGKHVLSPGNVKQDKVISPDRMTRRQSISPEKPLKTPPITVTRQAGLDWSKDGQKRAQFLYRNKPGKMDENLRKFEEMTKNVTVANIFTRKDMTAAIAEESGQKRMASIFDNQDYVPLPSSRRSSIGLYSNREVIEVLSNIQNNKKDRQKTAIKKELKSIQKRVKQHLEDIGIEYDDGDSDEEEEEDEFPQKPQNMPIFDTRQERDRMQERNYFVSKMEDVEVRSALRLEYIQDLCYWFEDNLNLCADMPTPEELAETVRDTIQAHSVITKSLNSFTRTGDKIVECGKDLLEETAKIIKERKELLNRKTKKERIIVYDDKILLSDPIKWESSVKTIISVFEDSSKMIKNLNFKNALRLGQRQFDYLMVAADKRYKELDEKKKQCNEISGKLHSAKVQNDKMIKEVEEQKRKTLKTVTELNEAKQTVTKLQEKNKEISNKVMELNSKIKLLEEELRKKLRTPTPPPTPPPPPEPEKVIVKVVDSATELRLQEVEQELLEAKAQIEELLSRVSQLQEQIVMEQNINKELQGRITELETIEVPEPEPMPQIEAPPAPTEPTIDKDSNYYKTLMAGMKNEFAAELEKVKAHVKREKTRNEANVRRLEVQQKDQLSCIQKDTIRMLRAIMHFRDQMIHVLDKETLRDPAQSLQDLGSLLKDKLSPDPREVLGQVVICVVEYLHKVEGILANAFLAMRMMMKNQVEKQVQAEIEIQQAREKQDKENKKVVKDIGKRKNVLNDAKDDVKNLAKKLKKAKNKLKRCKDTLDDVGGGDKRYRDLMDRYRQVWKLYRNMQKEMENLQNDFNTTMEQKLNEREAMMVTKLKMDSKKKEELDIEQLKVATKDHRKNLKLLTKAFKENKISQDVHLMANALIHKTLEIQRMKLQGLCEQYITFRTVQESKARVSVVLEDEELAIDVRKDLQQYMDLMDKKFDLSRMKWREESEQMKKEKGEIDKKIYFLFNEVLVDSGILLIHPLLKASSKVSVMQQAASRVTKDKMKSLLRRRPRMMTTLPEIICGNQVQIQDTRQRYWSSQLPPAEPTPQVTEPHMMAYEINRPRLMSLRTVKNNLREFPVLRAESFNIGRPQRLQYIRDMPFLQKKTKPYLCSH